jgi:hypothetical protein
MTRPPAACAVTLAALAVLAGTKIFVDKNRNIVLENYGQQPIRFNEIKPLK